MKDYFESPFKGKPLIEQVKHPNIKVGRYSYYSGYYHGHSFDDCARFLLPDRDDVDKLIIGSFCSIGTGASFIMAGNQGHRYDWASSFPFFYMPEESAFAGARDAFEKAGDPAKPVKKRFTDQGIAMLLEMQWWDWPLEQITSAMPFLCSADIAGL